MKTTKHKTKKTHNTQESNRQEPKVVTYRNKINGDLYYSNVREKPKLIGSAKFLLVRNGITGHSILLNAEYLERVAKP